MSKGEESEGLGEVIQIQVEVSAEFLRAIQRLVPCRKGRK